MPYEEKSAWLFGATAVVAYTVYLVVVVGRAAGMPLQDVPYVAPLLWSIGGAIVGSILLHAIMGMFSAKADRAKDERDREIYRVGEHIGQSFVVIGAVAALLMAMAELDHFWIANTIYLAFVLSAILGSMAKIAAYREGFQQW